MLEDSININNLCCSGFKKELVKPLKKWFFWTQFAQKGGHYGFQF